MTDTAKAARFHEALKAFDHANSADPEQVIVDGVSRPRELVQAERLSAWVERLDAQASEALRLAARCQHIRRFEIPRSSYPDGRVGYLKWRTTLARFHADSAAQLLESAGYEPALIEEVRRINLKQNLKNNRDVQTMEDALCLAFLAHEFSEFCQKYPAEKVIEVVQKTWRKMSPGAHELALALPQPPELLALIQRALAASLTGDE